MGLVNTRSPECAYASKNNILFPGSASQATAAANLAAQRDVEALALSQETVSRSGNQLTVTKNIAR